MKNMKMTNAIEIAPNIKRIALSIVVIVCTACAGATGINTIEEKRAALKSRVERLCDAKVKGDWATVYDLFDPSFQKSTPKEKFINSDERKIKFLAYKIENIEILPSNDKAKVKIKWDIEMMGYKFSNAPRIQIWKLVDGNWYLQVKKQR